MIETVWLMGGQRRSPPGEVGSAASEIAVWPSRPSVLDPLHVEPVGLRRERPACRASNCARVQFQGRTERGLRGGGLRVSNMVAPKVSNARA
jgi:hypothetical protein